MSENSMSFQNAFQGVVDAESEGNPVGSSDNASIPNLPTWDELIASAIAPTDPPPSPDGTPVDLNTLTEGVDYATGELVIKLKAGIQSDEAIGILQEEIGAVASDSVQNSSFQLFKLDNMSVAEAIEYYSSHDLIEYIEPNYTVSVQDTPNDDRYDRLWGLHNTGQTGGTPDADIDAPEAWDLATGSDVIVGVVDTGVDYNHPDLTENMWRNPGEIAGDGIDNDGNGYIDDVFGYDFVNNDGDPFDDHSHGTHVAGTIAAQGNNNIGVIGVAPDAQIMALKFLNDRGSGSTFNAVRAIEYATMMGVNLTNNSWGGGGYSQALHDAIQAAGEQNQLFVAASGNHGGNNDLKSSYPSSYDLDNVIAVARTDSRDRLASSSGYGATTVDLGAPGSGIHSTTPGGKYSNKSGTSMASPHVAGAAALVWSQNPNLTALEVKDKLLNSVDPVDSLKGKTVSGGRLNAFKALSGSEPSGGGGGTPIPIPASLDYTTGFEAGNLGTEWSKSITFEGRVGTTTAYAKSGSHSLLLDDSVDGSETSTSAAILHLDTSAFLNVQLNFSWLDLNDESNAGLDGVFVSSDGGTSWTEVHSLTEGSSTEWTDVS
ncbi:MAG: S8 family peptidase, partial [Cyanobacteriota bacterium]|nr:S8 family peptidase [Cyanobacteriota bacterium]